ADNGATVGTNTGKAGNLQVTATDNSTSAARATVGSGAIGFAAGGSFTDATTSPTVEAFLGPNVHVVLADALGHAVVVKAISNDAEGDARSKSFGGGAVPVGGPEASAPSKPVVHAYIGGGSTIVSGGGVQVDAESNANGNGTPLTDHITAMTPDGGSPTPDSVGFTAHGLITGDPVLYQSNGGGVIRGLHDNHVYRVTVLHSNPL